MSKRIVLVDTSGGELFSGESMFTQIPPPAAAAEHAPVADGPVPDESGIFLRGGARIARRIRKRPRAA